MPAQTWFRTSNRLVRPFIDVSDILEKCELRLERNGTFSSKDTFAIGDMDPGNLGVAIKIPIPPEDLETRTSLNREDLSIAIIITDHRLKKSECVFKACIDEIDGEPYELSNQQMGDFFWPGYVSIDVVILLSRDKDIIPTKPFRQGHWLARKRFSLNAENENPSFRIIPWTSEQFIERGLPGDTVYFVDFIDENLNIPFSELENALRIYIHEDIFNILSRNEGAAINRLAERILQTEILSCIIAQSLNSISGDDLIEDGVLSSLVRKIENATGVGMERLKQFSARPGHSELKAVVQSFRQLKQSFERGGI